MKTNYSGMSSQKPPIVDRWRWEGHDLFANSLLCQTYRFQMGCASKREDSHLSPQDLWRDEPDVPTLPMS